MEFGQILIAQATTLLSLLIVLLSVESSYITRICTLIYSNKWINVSDDKGLFLFLFLTYLIIAISILEMLRNACSKNLRLKDKIVYIQTCNYNNSFLLFANFLSLYIYRKLSTRTLHFLLIGIWNCAMYNLTYLLDFKYVSGFIYCNFLLCNIFNLLSTYFNRFEYVLELIIGQYKKYILFD